MPVRCVWMEPHPTLSVRRTWWEIRGGGAGGMGASNDLFSFGCSCHMPPHGLSAVNDAAYMHTRKARMVLTPLSISRWHYQSVLNVHHGFYACLCAGSRPYGSAMLQRYAARWLNETYPWFKSVGMCACCCEGHAAGHGLCSACSGHVGLCMGQQSAYTARYVGSEAFRL